MKSYLTMSRNQITVVAGYLRRYEHKYRIHFDELVIFGILELLK